MLFVFSREVYLNRFLTEATATPINVAEQKEETFLMAVPTIKQLNREQAVYAIYLK
jgi:hypothetical protein